VSLDIVKKIILNTNNSKPNDRIIIKQGCIGTITLAVTINDKGGVLEIPIGSTAKVKMLKPDKKQVLNDCTISANTVNVLVTEQMQAASGDGYCEVLLFNGTKTLASATFPITIEASVHDDSQLESLPEYQSLINALIKIGDAIPKAEQAYTVAMQAQAIVDDIQDDFAQMQTDNANAVSSANTAASNANSKASLANTAATNANNKASLADTAASNANAATANANSAATAANTATNNAQIAADTANNTNQQLIVAEADRAAYYNAYKVCEPYDNIKNYIPGNKVTYQGSTYQNILACTGVLPNNTTNWIMIAAKGLDGEGSGDMTTSVYDPTGKSQDIFAYADTHDTKNNTTTFFEADADVDIVSGEKHSTIFGKILKSIKTLRTALSGKIDIVSIIQNTTTNNSAKVPSSAVTYGLQNQITTLNDNLAHL
jgi:hypothetical protein